MTPDNPRYVILTPRGRGLKSLTTAAAVAAALANGERVQIVAPNEAEAERIWQEAKRLYAGGGS